MINDGLLTVLFLLLSGGILAYMGDLAGRRYSKTRKRLFGLRPKYASALWAGVVGVGVSAFIYGLLSFVSSDFQDAIFRIQSIKKELQTSSEKLAETEKTYELLQDSYRFLDDNIKILTQQLNDSNKQVENLYLQKTNLELEIINYSETAKGLTIQIKELEEGRGQLIKDLESRENQVEILKEEENTLNENISDLTVTLNRTQLELEERNEQLALLKEDVLQVTAALNAAEVRASEGTLVFVKSQELKRFMIPENLDPAFIESYLKDSFKKLIEDTELLGVSFAFETEESLTSKAIAEKENGNYFLRIIANSNVFAGDAIKVDFNWVPVQEIFQEGEILLDRFFSDTSSLENNYLFLEDLLESIEDIAKKRGVFPDIKTQKRVFFPSWKLTNRAAEMAIFSEGVLVSVHIVKTVYNFESLSKIEITLEGK